MKYNGVELILDNFREVLKDYCVDDQDVVRSAILDGVDISEYIKPCKGNSYKLDQIRLACKEKLPKEIFGVLSGEQLHAVRSLSTRNYSVNQIVNQISSGRMSARHLEYLVKWVTDGVDISRLKVSLIPKKMLELFDIYLSQGKDMSKFNTGKVYSSEYVLYCIFMQDQGKDIERFTSKKWSEDVLSILSTKSTKFSDQLWDLVMSVIDESTDIERVSLMFTLSKGNLPVKKLSDPVYDNESLKIIYNASKQGLDYKCLMDSSFDYTSRKAKYDEMVMNKGKKISGIIRHF